jgi:hypothetical protein
MPLYRGFLPPFLIVLRPMHHNLVVQRVFTPSVTPWITELSTGDIRGSMN